MINLNKANESAKALATAFGTDDPNTVQEALEGFYSNLAEELAVQYKEAMASGDRAVLAQRGFRQLTSTEERYYQKVINALKSPTPQQAFAEIPTNGDGVKALPTTVIDQVLDDIKASRPLLNEIKLTNTSVLTRWIKNDYDEQFALWGALESAITKEITGGIKVKEITLNKLSCYGILSIDMLKLGPSFFDAYLRAALADSMGAALEKAVISGIGVKGEPVGLTREFASTTTVNQTTGYPAKTAVEVTSFDPKSYGALVAQLAKDEDGKVKKPGALESLTLICNTADYLTKVVPATTVLTSGGTYANNLFPIPTKVVCSEFVEEGKAILALLDEYSMFVGGERGVTYSDEYKFLEDQRTYKTVQYAYGEPKDDTTALVLDITKLDPAYITVKAAAVESASQGSTSQGSSSQGSSSQGV